MNKRQVYFYAFVSVALTVGVAIVVTMTSFPDHMHNLAVNEQGQFRPDPWLPILLVTVSSTVAVTILSAFTLRLLRELKVREQKIAQSEEERLSFAADAAHELRTPLAILRANIDSMDESEVARQLRSDIAHITRIIEQVLAKSRIEAIAVKPDETVDLAKLCTDMAAYIAPLVIKEGRSIEVLGAERPIVINANAFAIEQALRNLVENAIKYSARGSTITIEVEQDGEGNFVRVIDRGRGVPQEERELIFERFRRADRRGGGSGLGLSIVSRVAQAHGGRVFVDDAPEGGAIFTLYFPLRAS